MGDYFLQDKIYHVSKIPELHILEPRVCSHGKAYVYASYHKETALLFGGELWSDWDFIYKRNYENGELTLSETYQGSLDRVFDKKSCYLYEVENSGFKQGQTHMWDEIVSESPTKVLKQMQILDLKQELLNLQNQGLINIELFQDTSLYQEKVKAHILNLQKYSDINRQNNSELLKEKLAPFIE